MTREVPYSREKIEELKAATREANEVLAGFNASLKDARSLKREIDAYISERVDKKIEGIVADKLAVFNETIGKAIEDATQAVFDRFDTITKELLGESKRARRKHGESIPEAFERRNRQ